MKNVFPLYRHMLVYSESNEFQKCKYISKADFKACRDLNAKLENAIRKAEFENKFDPFYSIEIDKYSHYAEEAADEPLPDESMMFWSKLSLNWFKYYDYAYRYKTLSRDCKFRYILLYLIENVINHASSYEELLFRSTVNNIPEKIINYAAVYMIVSDRFRELTGKDSSLFEDENLLKLDYFDQYAVDIYKMYKIMKEIYAKVCSGEAEICAFKEFMKFDPQ